ncbi:MAG: hypothetical protein J0I14_02955 [Propionibacteriaceae bacterium]|jgi:hypothetical protein|nr:hypothetical protein [Propionibacteriaceae bacterium]
MAEIRKFDPAAGSAIAQALKAAMGEPVRPNQPGARPEASRPAAETAAPSVVTVNIKTVVVPSDDEED